MWTIKRMFAWGAEEELVSAEVVGAIKLVKDLQLGKTTAREYNDVAPVPDSRAFLPNSKNIQYRP